MKLCFDPQALLLSSGKLNWSSLGVKQKAQGLFNNLWLWVKMPELQAISAVCSSKDVQL